MREKINNWWEGICDHCGLCCYEKDYYPDGTLMTLFQSPCEYLTEENMTCRIYEDRFKVCDQCKKMTLFRALFASYVPEECAYYKKFRFWKCNYSTSDNLIKS